MDRTSIRKPLDPRIHPDNPVARLYGAGLQPLVPNRARKPGASPRAGMNRAFSALDLRRNIVLKTLCPPHAIWRRFQGPKARLIPARGEAPGNAPVNKKGLKARTIVRLEAASTLRTYLRSDLKRLRNRRRPRAHIRNSGGVPRRDPACACSPARRPVPARDAA